MNRVRYIASESGRYSAAVKHRGDERRNMYGTVKDGATRRKREREYLMSLSEEELLELSKEKAPNGCSTELALKALRLYYQKNTS